jgi:endonuclease G, mitochondrial
MEIRKSLKITAADGGSDGATVTIPIEITVRIGADEGAPEARAAVTLAAGEMTEDPAIAAALALARSNRDLTPQQYYDEEADSRERQDYYRNVAENAQPADFHRALNRLLTDTHRTKLDYSPATQLYPEVDLHPNGKIVSIYSERMLDPEELIRADAEIDRARRVALRAITESRAFSMEDVAVFASKVEAAFPYNCEHVVPQSWFKKRNPMRGDLHHLFACELKCNEFRADIPYFDFERDDIDRADCGQADTRKFEPIGGKGAVARATLYFLLRYPGEIDNNDREYTRDRLNVLLRWHAENKVRLHEKHRNRSIQRKQGNRNPLVDHPEWAARIDFSKGLR